MEIDKIYNMDCLEGMKQIPDGSVDLIVTDPPYEFETRGSGFHKKRDYYDEIAAQGLAAGITEEYLVEMERVMKATNIYLFCNKNQLRMYFNFYKDKNCDLLVWHKLNPIPVVNNKYLSDLEYIFFARDKGVKLGGGYNTLSKVHSIIAPRMCATVASIGTASRSAHFDSLIYALFMAKRPNPTGHANNGETIVIPAKLSTMVILRIDRERSLS